MRMIPLCRRHLAASLCVAVALCSLAWAGIRGSAATEAAQDEEKWVQLFDGESLEGWVPKIRGYPAGENFGETFRVEDGLLKVSYDAYEAFEDRFGHLFYERPFSHYRLRVEYRFSGEQIEGGEGWALLNSGIMLHGQSPESMDEDQRFPVSLEVQLLAAEEGERPTANLCTPGTHVEMDGELVTRHCNNSSSPTFEPDEWVTVEVEVRGGALIRHLVNGQEVIRYANPVLDEGDPDAKKLIEAGSPVKLTSGTISLQSESHPVEFRKVELLPLESQMAP